MVDMVVETIEPDPSATSIANDQTVNNTKDETVADIPKETSGMSLALNTTAQTAPHLLYGPCEYALANLSTRRRACIDGR